MMSFHNETLTQMMDTTAQLKKKKMHKEVFTKERKEEGRKKNKT